MKRKKILIILSLFLQLVISCQGNRNPKMIPEDIKLEPTQAREKKAESSEKITDHIPDESEKGWKGLKGIEVKAFLIAYQSFLDDNVIPVQKKKIENYNIGIKETSKIIWVNFIPQIKIGSISPIGGVTELGSPLQYKIDKNGFKIVEIIRSV